MKPLVVFLVVCLGHALSHSSLRLAHRSIDDQWQSYKAKYNKQYENGPEEHLHKSAFIASLEKIEEHNASGKSWQIGLNEFSDDATLDQTHQQAASNVQRPKPRDALHDDAVQGPAAREIPLSYDLRTDICMPPIKNRGNCKKGDWALAAVSAVEFFNCKSTGSLVLLSEQQVLDCAVYPGTSGCTKGELKIALGYLGSYGSLSSTTYPFTSGATGITDACKYCSLTGTNKIASLPFERNTNIGDKAMVDSLMSFGLLTITAYFPTGKLDSIYEYKSGVYDPSNAAYDAGFTEFTVNIAGWGTDPATGKKYWIVRHSLGQDWGQSGYFLLARGSKNQIEIYNYYAIRNN